MPPRERPIQQDDSITLLALTVTTATLLVLMVPTVIPSLMLLQSVRGVGHDLMRAAAVIIAGLIVSIFIGGLRRRRAGVRLTNKSWPQAAPTEPSWNAWLVATPLEVAGGSCAAEDERRRTTGAAQPFSSSPPGSTLAWAASYSSPPTKRSAGHPPTTSPARSVSRTIGIPARASEPSGYWAGTAAAAQRAGGL